MSPAMRPDFKVSYRHDWALANAREALVLSLLNSRLPRLFRNHTAWAEPSGHGALMPTVVEGWHSSAEDKFDLVVKIDGRPCCYIEVSGVNEADSLDRRDIGLPPDYFCVGSWKLRDAKRHGILDRTWFAFAIAKSKAARFLYAPHLDWLVQSEYPGLRTAVLRKGEDISYCLDRKLWRTLRSFLSWIKTRGLALAYSRGDEMCGWLASRRTKISSRCSRR